MIGSSLDPARYADARFVAERLQRMTSGRRRIELPLEHVDTVTATLREFQPGIADAAPAVVERSGDGPEPAGPHPPPPGVRTRSTSPAARCTVHLSGSGAARDSSPPGSSQFSPTAPGSPPASPDGGVTRRSVISDTVGGREHLELAPDAVAAGVRTGAAAAPPQAVAPHAQRERALERLDRGVERVGHRGVHAAHARRPTAAHPARRRWSRSRRPSSWSPTMVPPSSTLFIVPWLAAPTRSGATCASAPRHTSATRWLTSTLPAPTATGGTAATTVPARRDHAHRPQRAAVGGERGIGDGADRERDRAHRHRLDRVDVAGPLRVGAGEVERDVVALDAHLDHDARRRLLLRTRAGGVEHVVVRTSARRAARASAARIRRSP